MNCRDFDQIWNRLLDAESGPRRDDGPEAKALADSGALRVIAPSRDSVPPVLYDLRDPAGLRTLLIGRASRPSLNPV